MKRVILDSRRESKGFADTAKTVIFHNQDGSKRVLNTTQEALRNVHDLAWDFRAKYFEIK
jgi:hypothetical protein